jgi:HlyD family secretion protein
MKSWRIVMALLLCLTFVGSIACIEGNGSAEEVKEQFVEVVRGDLMVSVSGSGNIAVTNEANLAFGSGGKIDKIYVDEGDEVSKGEVLAKLDTSALELALTQAEVALIQVQAALVQARVARDEAEYNLNQLKKVLHASHDRVKLAESALEAAEAALEAAEAQLEAAEQAVAEAQKQLDETSITAPFDGIVANVHAEEGDIIPSPTMSPRTIIHLTDPTSMELDAEVDEIDIPEVKLGQRAIIEIDALPAVLLEGEVTAISTLSMEMGGVVLYEVTTSFDVPEDVGLKAGMSATADIIINERSNILLVPSRAITQDSQGNPIVKVVVNEETEERPVVTGISDGFDTEIIDGLNEGEVVVVERRAG